MYIANQNQRIEKLAKDGYNFEFEKYFSSGWELFKKAAGQYVIYTLLYLAISIGLGIIPILGFFASLVIGPALAAGYFVATRKLQVDGRIEIGDFFKSFDFVLQLCILGIVTSLLTLIALVFLILPGIWFAVAASLASLLVVFGKIDFWESTKASIKIVNAKWFHWFAFFILILLFNLLGFIALGIGLFITIPTSFCAMYCAYHDIVGFDEADKVRDASEHLVDF
jgi:hypothetical protein